jgi:anti-anti-sigma factor
MPQEPKIADVVDDTAPGFSVVLVPWREEVLLQAIGELDLAAAPKLHEQIGELLAAGCQQLVIDLRQLSFIDVTGVKLLLRLAQDASDDGWRLSLIEAGGQVRQMLTLTHVLDQLPFRTSDRSPRWRIPQAGVEVSA